LVAGSNPARRTRLLPQGVTTGNPNLHRKNQKITVVKYKSSPEHALVDKILIKIDGHSPLKNQKKISSID
jgi:hypothetical protein